MAVQAARQGARGAGIGRIGLLTGGGDAPGLNAVIRSVVLAAAARLGVPRHPRRLQRPAGARQCAAASRSAATAGEAEVHAIGHLGGTILGSTNRGNPLHYPTLHRTGSSWSKPDRSSTSSPCAARAGSTRWSSSAATVRWPSPKRCTRMGCAWSACPRPSTTTSTIPSSTFGFDTAVGFATECIDRLHTTAHSQHRVMVVEVMGRYAGWIALHAGIAGGAHAILIPEIPFRIEKVQGAIARRDASGPPPCDRGGRPKARKRSAANARCRPPPGSAGRAPGRHRRAPGAANWPRAPARNAAASCSATCCAAAARRPSTG
jgi:hypothetical protein